MDNIVKVSFGAINKCRTRPLYVLDYGIYLQINDDRIDDSTVYSVHFSKQKSDGSYYSVIKTEQGVKIPEALLQSNGTIYAWLYYHTGESDGETLFEIEIPIIARPDTPAVIPTPHDHDLIEDAIAALNVGVEEARDYAAAADASAIEAAGSADDAAASATTAGNAATAAESSASTAYNHAQDANGYATAAQEAKTDAETAKTKAETAQDKAEDAKASAGAAAAQTALDVVATGQSANAAAGSAGEASGYATTASGYATDANNAKLAAQGAQTAAETAQGLAEAAQTGAEAAQTAAETARDAAIAATEDKAPVILDSASGAIVSIVDGAGGMNARSLVASMSPIQDLYGYSNPWPAGGGVNKIDFSKCTANRTAFGLTSAISGEHFRFTGTCSSGGAHTWVFGTVDIEQRSIIATLSLKGFVISGGSALSITEIAYNSSTGALSLNIGGLVTGTVYDFSIGIVAYEGSTAPESWSPYSNICPITGRTGVTVTRTGKNLWDASQMTESSAWVIVTLQLPLGTYTMSTDKPDGNGLSVYFKRPSQSQGATTIVYSGHPVTRVLSDVNDPLQVIYRRVSGEDVFANYKFQIELGSTASAYEPYTGTSFPVTWQTEAGTVYGGTVDLVSGVLTVDRAGLDLGTLTYSKSSIVTNGFVATGGMPNDFPLAPSSSAVPNWLCSQYKVTSNNDLESASVDFAVAWRVSGQNKGVIVKDSNYASYYTGNDMASFKTAMSGVMLVYYMTEPQEYTLTPTQVLMLLGANNVWATGDTVDLTYPCDTKLYIEKLTRPTEDDMTANANIASGKYFMVGNRLFRSIASIPNGTEIIVGTNCVTLSLADALNALNN